MSSGGDRPTSPWSHFGLGFEIVIPVVLGIYVGYRMDVWLETSPWLMVTGALLGLVLSFYSLFRRIQGQQKGGR